MSWAKFLITVAAMATTTQVIQTGIPTAIGGNFSLLNPSLDPLTRNAGALHVLPGSHRPDHFIRRERIDVNNSMALCGLPPREFPGSIAIESNPGDIVIFNHDLYHAIFGGGPRRWMFTMNCNRHAKTPEDLETAHQYLSIHSPGGNKVKTSAGMFYPTITDTADAERLVHLRQPIEIHDHLFPHLAREVVQP